MLSVLRGFRSPGDVQSDQAEAYRSGARNEQPDRGGGHG